MVPTSGIGEGQDLGEMKASARALHNSISSPFCLDESPFAKPPPPPSLLFTWVLVSRRDVGHVAVRVILHDLAQVVAVPEHERLVRALALEKGVCDGCVVYSVSVMAMWCTV